MKSVEEWEAASHHMKALKNKEANTIKEISKKKSGQHKHSHRIKKPPQSVDQKALKKMCLFSCQIHVMKKEMCPAWGKTCAACGERNRFEASNKCKLQSVNSLADDYSSDSFESSTESISAVTAWEDQVVNSVDPGNQLIFCEMEINNKPVRMQIVFGVKSLSFQNATWGTCLFGLKGFVCRCGTRHLYLPLASVRWTLGTPPPISSTKWTCHCWQRPHTSSQQCCCSKDESYKCSFWQVQGSQCCHPSQQPPILHTVSWCI